jgi:biotin transport system substrate-specific component
VPVFAGYTSGAGILFGVTGGYLFGYIPLAFLSGWFYERAKQEKKTLSAFVGMIIGTAVLYALGTVWFIYLTQMDFNGAMMACVIPFLPGDFIKMIAVTAVAPQLDRAVSLRPAKTSA